MSGPLHPSALAARLSRPREFPPWALILIAAVLAGFFFSGQIYFTRLALGDPTSWAQVFYWSFGDSFEWAILCLAIFALCRRFPLTRGAWMQSLPVHLVGAILANFAHTAMCAGAAWLQCCLVGEPLDYFSSWQYHLIHRSAYNLAMYFMIVSAWQAWEYRRRVRERERELGEMERQLAEAQVNALRMQLNPHFLFNTLNTVSSLMLTDVRSANQMLSRLGALLREALDGGTDPEITLERELMLTQHYLDIEQVRFGGRLGVAMEVSGEMFPAAVPAFLLQPLVENSIRHAIAHRTEGGRIVLRAQRREDTLELEVIDNGPGTATPPPATPRRRESIGLGNTRERLAKMYGARQQLVFARNSDGGVTVRVLLPYRELSPRAS